MVKDDNKYAYFMLTVQITKKKDLALTETTLVTEYPLPPIDKMVNALKVVSERWLFQREVGETSGKAHYQGCFKTPIRKRISTVLNELQEALDYPDERMAQFQIEPMQGSWEQAKAYCSKSETSEDGIVFTNEVIYSGSDVAFLDDKTARFPWQDDIINQIIDEDTGLVKDATDREITWIWCPQGNSGKSKLVKYCCVRYDHIVKISFGSSNQLRSAVISAGKQLVYFIDIPRTLGSDDSLPSMISCLEDLKNGFVVSAMYGKYQKMICDPVHIIVFSNRECPKTMMSADRWKYYMISHQKTLMELST